jgi:hypothetical protein
MDANGSKNGHQRTDIKERTSKNGHQRTDIKERTSKNGQVIGLCALQLQRHVTGLPFVVYAGYVLQPFTSLTWPSCTT